VCKIERRRSTREMRARVKCARGHSQLVKHAEGAMSLQPPLARPMWMMGAGWTDRDGLLHGNYFSRRSSKDGAPRTRDGEFVERGEEQFTKL